MALKEKIGKELLIFDGGYGTLLQERGLPLGELPEKWNLDKKEELIGIHQAYLQAGSNLMKANTFGANGFKFGDTGAYSLENVIRAGIENAKEARRREHREEDAYVLLDIGSLGKLLEPLGELPFETAYEHFCKIITFGEKYGMDGILIETMNDTYEVKAAVLAAKECSKVPVFVTVILNEQGKLLTGADVRAVTALLEGLKVDAFGLNCGLGPVQMKPFVEELLQVTSTPVVMNPNAGLPKVVDGKTIFDISKEEYSAYMEEFFHMGCSILGGCCGTTPEFIREVKERVAGKKVIPVEKKHRSFVSSYSQAVEIGKVPVLIGERINPNGKPKFKQALRDRNLDYILDVGLNQVENGAHILDVNVGLPEIDEPEMMEAVVTQLQSITGTPLQIDTTDREALERSLRLYNGKPLVNSVNGSKESMDMVFPLVAKYGGVIVGLTLDERGIPEDVDGRIEIAGKIYEEAAKYGIEKEDIIIDTLTMTMSTDSQAANLTLEAVRRVRDELHGNTVLGVSNISFGLPMRSIVNANFFTLALYNGLSAAIMNPNSVEMMEAYDGYLVLSGWDHQCKGYVEKYKDQVAEKKTLITKGGAAETTGSAIYTAVVKGLKDKAGEAVKEALHTQNPLEIINQEMIPALNKIGEDFETGKAFLPQLLMSADAANAGFDEIKSFYANQGTTQTKKGKIVLATVKGDIHEIGKNIVKVLLDNYGYEVLDLGKDVAPETILDTVQREQVRFVGLSALMTTTVCNMEDTITLLHQEVPGCKIVVGGAVLNEDYAEKIGADYYAKDAMGTVRLAEEFFAK